MRTAAKSDKNQPEIVDAYRKIGAIVLIVSQLKNCFDILVAYEGVIYMVEIKDGDKFPKYFKDLENKQDFLVNQLTKGEKEFYNKCVEQKAPYMIVWDIDSALNIFK